MKGRKENLVSFPPSNWAVGGNEMLYALVTESHKIAVLNLSWQIFPIPLSTDREATTLGVIWKHHLVPLFWHVICSGYYFLWKSRIWISFQTHGIRTGSFISAAYLICSSKGGKEWHHPPSISVSCCCLPLFLLACSPYNLILRNRVSTWFHSLLQIFRYLVSKPQAQREHFPLQKGLPPL